MPEQSISEKVNFYKGETRTLRTRIKNLEKRIVSLEERFAKYKNLLQDEKTLDFGTPPHRKKTKAKDDFLKQLRKDFGKEEE